MNIPSLAKTAVNLAFTIAGSQVVLVVLYKRPNVTFDFNSNAAESDPVTTVTLEAFEIDHKKPLEGRQTNIKQLLFKTAELGDITFYEYAVINGLDWLIGGIKSKDDNLSIVEIYRES